MNYKRAKYLSDEEFKRLPEDLRLDLFDERGGKSVRFGEYVYKTIVENLNPIDIECLKLKLDHLLQIVEKERQDDDYDGYKAKNKAIDRIEDFLSLRFKRHFYFWGDMIFNGNSAEQAPKCAYLGQVYYVEDLIKKI